MGWFSRGFANVYRQGVPIVWTMTLLLVLPGVRAVGQKADPDVLRIGSSGDVSPGEPGSAKEKSALESLRSFIKSETGMDNDISRQKDWREVADQMAKGQLQLGVFQGYEFAWAREKYAGLKPLALAININRYPTIFVVTGKASQAKDFAGLAGQSVALPAGTPPTVRFFVERQTGAKKPEAFFSKITAQENVEDALDDVVDGVVQAAVVDRAALEAFKRRKPGRHSKLKEIAQSQPFPPVVLAYQEKALTEAKLRGFRDGLLNAHRKEKGLMMLTLFRLTGFEEIPEDLAKVLAETRKTYPLLDSKPK